MARDIHEDPIYEFFIARHKDQFLREVLEASDAERACSTFPDDRILDFIELLNSNVAISLLIRYPEDLVGTIRSDIGALKYRITPAQLKRRLKKAKE